MLPADGNILLSLVNTYLRDGGTLDDFCAEKGAEMEEVTARLSALGYYYDEEAETFRLK